MVTVEVAALGLCFLMLSSARRILCSRSAREELKYWCWWACHLAWSPSHSDMLLSMLTLKQNKYFMVFYCTEEPGTTQLSKWSALYWGITDDLIFIKYKLMFAWNRYQSHEFQTSQSFRTKRAFSLLKWSLIEDTCG